MSVVKSRGSQTNQVNQVRIQIDRAKKYLMQFEEYEQIILIPVRKPVSKLSAKKKALAKICFEELIENYLGDFYEMTERQVQLLSESIFENGERKSVEELHVILRNGALGKYGKIFGNIVRPSDLNGWFEIYDMEFYPLLENIVHNSHVHKKLNIESEFNKPALPTGFKISTNNSKKPLPPLKLGPKKKKYVDLETYFIDQNKDPVIEMDSLIREWTYYYEEIYSKNGSKEKPVVMKLDEYVQIKKDHQLKKVNGGKIIRDSRPLIYKKN